VDELVQGGLEGPAHRELVDELGGLGLTALPRGDAQSTVGPELAPGRVGDYLRLRDERRALLQFARWGRILALNPTFDPRIDGELRAIYELRLGEDHFRAEVADGRIELVRGSGDQPDATIETSVAIFRSLVFGCRPLADALHCGDVTLEGDHHAVARLLRLFPRPTPAPPVGA